MGAPPRRSSPGRGRKKERREKGGKGGGVGVLDEEAHFLLRRKGGKKRVLPAVRTTPIREKKGGWGRGGKKGKAGRKQGHPTVRALKKKEEGKGKKTTPTSSRRCHGSGIPAASPGRVPEKKSSTQTAVPFPKERKGKRKDEVAYPDLL